MMTNDKKTMNNETLGKVSGGYVVRNPDGTYSVYDDQSGKIAPSPFDNPEEARRSDEEYKRP